MDLTADKRFSDMVVFHYFINNLLCLFAKWWSVSVGLVSSWVVFLFGDNLLLFIDPELVKSLLPFVGSTAMLIWTGFIAWRKGSKELDAIQGEARQDEEKHLLEVMKSLIEKELIDKDAPILTKISQTKEFLKGVRSPQ